MNRKWPPIVIAAVVLMLATIACGSSNTGEKIGSTQSNGQPPATESSAQAETYKVGDVVKVQDHTIVLNSATVDGGTLVANFTIDNPGSKELNVSSLVSFEAKDAEGTKLEQEMFDCPSGGLDGTVLAGDKLKGNICWKSAAGAKGARVYYKASLLGSGAVVWALDSVAGDKRAAARPSDQPAAVTPASQPTPVPISPDTAWTKYSFVGGTFSMLRPPEWNLYEEKVNEVTFDYEPNDSLTVSLIGGQLPAAVGSPELVDWMVEHGSRVEGNTYELIEKGKWTDFITASYVLFKVTSGKSNLVVYDLLLMAPLGPDHVISAEDRSLSDTFTKRDALPLAQAAASIAANSSAAAPAATTSSAAAPSSEARSPSVASFKIGDIIKIEGHTIVLNSATVEGGTLVANFTIDNPGSEGINVSSLMNFDAKDAEGTKLEQEMFDCPSGGLDGTVLAGDKLKGNICWKGATGTSGLRIYYTPNLFRSGTVVWGLQ